MYKYSVAETKQELKNSIGVYLEKDAEGRYIMEEIYRMPFYLEGPPGVGKTQLTKQVADELGIGFVSLSITHHTRNTVLGLPKIEKLKGADEGNYTAYTMSEIIAQVHKAVEEGHTEGILLIDEFACMAESLVAPMLAFLQTKNIGNYTLPEGWIIVLCSNPLKYNKNSRVFDMAIMDRVRVMNVDFDAKEFLNYATEKKFHPTILEYLRVNPLDTHLCDWNKDRTQVIVTTRGWENLSYCIYGYERKDQPVKEELVAQFIKSEDIAHRFFVFYNACIMGNMSPEQLYEIVEGIHLDEHVARVSDKSYIIRWNLMVQLQKILGDKAKSIENGAEKLRKHKKVAEELYEGKDTIHCRLMAKLAGRMGLLENGWEKDLLVNYKQEYERRMVEENIDKLNNAESDRVMKEIMEASWVKPEEELQREAEELSKRITYACEFVQRVEGNNHLLGPFVNMLSKYLGVMEAMCRVENPIYLKGLRKRYGNEAV